MPSSRPFILVVAVLALACAAGTIARPAAAGHKPACWQVLLNDWYDGRIDGTYPIHCYRDALKHLPSDVDTYSSARDDIQRALQSARLQARRSGGSLGPDTLLRPSTTTTATKTETTTKTTTRRKAHSGGNNGVITVAVPGRKPDKGLATVADSGSASGLPLPLLILGGLALALVAAGGAGLAWRRYQGRRPAS